MPSFQLIVDPPSPGAWNMAADEWLLQRAANDGVLTLRFYEWAEPTLSLGYFQAHADRQSHAASSELPLVRRASGGGALVHHEELTYSLAVPAGHALAKNAEDLYDAAHESLVEVLNQSVARSDRIFSLCSETSPHAQSKRDKEPFLCFLRRSSGDVLGSVGDQPAGLPASTVDGRYKVCGSAQRRRRGAVLQHGGVLLARSPHAPELAGLADLLGVAGITAAAVRELWLPPLAARLALQVEPPTAWSTQAEQEIRKIVGDKFADLAWSHRR